LDTAGPAGVRFLTDREVQRAAVNGTNLVYELRGQGPTAVLLHGFTLDLRMWDDQLPGLLDRFRVLRYDRRGFGRSDLPEPGLQFSPVEDLCALLAYLGIRKAHLIGLSAGGGLAVRFALEHPELVDRLVLVDSALEGFEWSADYRESYDRIDKVAESQGVGAARALWLSHPLFAPAREHPEIANRLAEMVGDYTGWHWLHDSVSPGLDPPAAKRLGSIQHPTLVMAGARDVPDHLNVTRVLARGIPGAQEIVIPGAGHMLNMEAPDEFNQLVLEFLRSTPSAPSAVPVKPQ
jgi:pimeloyl-ACP methyl ester carboxylesterase